ncbi:MAG: hypothetical protein WB919_09975 [Candidatus Sulfotelmatobacter sp.]
MTRPLLVVTGIFVSFQFAMMATFRPGDSFVFLRGIVILGSIPVFLLLIIALLATVWLGVRQHGLSKMEGWWWLSGPYPAAFYLSALLFHTPESEAILLPALFAVIAGISSAAWMVATIYQLAISRTNLSSRNAAMMAVVVLTGILFAVAEKSGL